MHMSKYISTYFKQNFQKLISLSLSLWLCLCVFLPAATVAADSPNRLPKTVRVAYYYQPAWQEGADAGGVKRGYSYEYLQNIAPYVNWRYDYVYGSFEDLYQEFLAGKIDIFAALMQTDERRGKVLFPELAMGDSSYIFLRRDNDLSINESLSSFRGKRIGTINGIMYSSLRQFFAHENVDVDIVGYDDADKAAAELQADKIDAFMGADSGALTIKYELEAFSIPNAQRFYIGVSTARPDILEELNVAQAELQQDRPQLINQLKEKYFSRTNVTSTLSKAERIWVEEHPVLRVGILSNYMPFSGINKNGEVTGIIRDLVPEMLKDLGLSDRITVEYKPYDSFIAMASALHAGEVDTIFPSFNDMWVSEQNGLATSDDVVTVTTDFAYLGEYSEAKEEKIGVIRGNYMQLASTRSIYPNARIVFYTDIDECLEAIKAGKVGGTILNGMRTYPLLRQGRYKMLNASPTPSGADLGFGVQNGDIALLHLLNRGINVLPENYVAVNVRGYEQELYEYGITDFLMDYQHLVIGISVLIAVLALTIAWMYIRAAKKEKRNQFVLEKALKLAEEGSKAKTSFLFSMSHDIRTPMNAILGFADLLAHQKHDPALVEDYIKKIRASGNFLLSLINNVLEMARIESGQETVEEEAVNCYDFVESLKDVFEASMASKNLHMHMDLNVQHVNNWMDATKVRQIFLNLISNSVKYTPNGGNIYIRLNELESDWDGYVKHEIIIEDDGVGMSEEFLERIFDEFSREKTSTDSRISGTGLGMSIVKKLVDLLGGEILVESALGKGSRFTVRLYFRMAEEKDLPRVKHEAESKLISDEEVRGKRVLIAEDNDLNAEIVMTVLDAKGCIVERAIDGVACVDMVSEHDYDYYDIIFMDIQMPHMDGLKATEVIRHMRDIRMAQIPIVAMTANAFEEDKKRCLEAGMNDHIAKPIDIQQLLRAIVKYSRKEQ